MTETKAKKTSSRKTTLPLSDNTHVMNEMNQSHNGTPQIAEMPLSLDGAPQMTEISFSHDPPQKTILPLCCGDPIRPAKLRVAAYCRVSTDRPDQEGSFENQQNYFQKLYERSDTEELAGIYLDHGLSGTQADRRPGFQQLLADCRRGNIDRVVCKSISRFARNVREALSALRELKALGVTVHFEKENIDTAEISDELMITIMEGLAEEESKSISRNTRWSLKRRMKNGTLKVARVPYGYSKNKAGELIIDEEKAEVIRRIFRLYLFGYGARRIAKQLNEDGLPSPTGILWSSATILKILSQEKYIGDIRWQKTRSTFMGKKWQINRGDEESYYIENAHPAIIDRGTFEKAAELRANINRSMKPPEKNVHPLRNKLTCTCGRSFILYKSTAGNYWKCTRSTDLKNPCSAAKVRDADILAAWDAVYEELKNSPADVINNIEIDIQKPLRKPKKNSTDKMNKYTENKQAFITASKKIPGSRSDETKSHAPPALQALKDEQEALFRKRYTLRKLCLEKKITPNELAEQEEALDREMNRLEAARSKHFTPEQKTAEATAMLHHAVSTMDKETFLRTMVEEITIDKGTAVFRFVTIGDGSGRSQCR